ncbi:hypothetical protein Y032_0009g515 [Ancylostoma ceylanicum]|nr:hypothetical protein Y032_0009g515 [Ancylostoma ceylanicum]
MEGEDSCSSDAGALRACRGRGKATAIDAHCNRRVRGRGTQFRAVSRQNYRDFYCGPTFNRSESPTVRQIPSC